MLAGGQKLIIQLILVTVIVAISFVSMRQHGARNQALRRLGLLFFMLCAIVSVFYPRILSKLAAWVGVGRGTDLLLYLLLLAFLASLANQFKRSVEHDRRLTKLARQLALSNAPDLRGTSSALPSSSGPDDVNGDKEL